ncbi:ribose-phosphate pyrophosphokinase [Candidatus Parcubacteria bacterium]|nr:ribose-phosphate pyrophosphokinase [Candidatus Parcubacteria bacterium]
MKEEELEKVIIVSGTSHPKLAKKTAALLEKECYFPEIYKYLTGDFEVALPCNVRRKIVFVIQTFPPNLEQVCYLFLETVFLVNAAYKASAEEVNLVVPHLGWDQSDKKWRGRMPIAGELIAAFFHWAGAKRFVGLQFHSPQFPGFFPLPTIVDHLVADPLLLEYVAKKVTSDTVLLPSDLGFAKSARKIAERLGVPMIEVEKERKSPHEVIIHQVFGNASGKRVIIWDDKIVAGTTVRAIVDFLEKQGAKEVIIVTTHGLFAGKAIENLKHPLIQEIVTTDSVPHSSELLQQLPITEISIAPLLADAIREISIEGGSVSKLFEKSVIKSE